MVAYSMFIPLCRYEHAHWLKLTLYFTSIDHTLTFPQLPVRSFVSFRPSSVLQRVFSKVTYSTPGTALFLWGTFPQGDCLLLYYCEARIRNQPSLGKSRLKNIFNCHINIDLCCEDRI